MNAARKFTSKLVENIYQTASVSTVFSFSVFGCSKFCGPTNSGPEKRASSNSKSEFRFPPKPRNAIDIYTCSHYNEQRAKLGGRVKAVNCGHIRRACYAQWAKMSPAERLPYKKQSEEQRRKYAAFLEKHGIVRGPKNAFLIFHSEQHKLQSIGEQSQIKPNDFGRWCGEKWRGMTADQRRPYHEEAVRRSQAYQARAIQASRHVQEALAKRHNAGSDALWTEYSRQFFGGRKMSRARRLQAQTDHQMPRRPNLPFLRFVHEQQSAARQHLDNEGRQIPGTVPTAPQLGPSWRALSPERKAGYQTEHQAAMKEWHRKMDAWKEAMKQTGKEKFIPIFLARPSQSKGMQESARKRRINRQKATFLQNN